MKHNYENIIWLCCYCLFIAIMIPYTLHSFIYSTENGIDIILKWFITILAIEVNGLKRKQWQRDEDDRIRKKKNA